MSGERHGPVSAGPIIWRWLDVMCEVLHPDDEELCGPVIRAGYQQQSVILCTVVQFVVDLPWEDHGRRNA